MLSSGWSDREGVRQLDTHGSKDQLTQTHWHVWLQSPSLSVPTSLSFHFSYLLGSLLCFSQTNSLHTVLCVTVELPFCVGLSGVELKPDIKHTTKQWSHENKMKLLWGSNREPSLQTHTQAFKWKHVLKAWLLKSLPCHSFIKNGADCTWKNLEGADLVTDRQKLPQHPAPFSPSASPVFKVTDGCFLLSFLLSLYSFFLIPARTWTLSPPPPALLNPHLQQTY